MMPDVQFYDYTKDFTRKKALRGYWNNYSLTFSLNEQNFIQASKLAKEGINISVVFKNKLPNNFLNKKVINGDKTDLRFIDPKNVIVGLLAKGSAKQDKTGFVIRG